MRGQLSVVGVLAGFLAVSPTAAFPQQVSFERSFDVSASPVLDVSTIRGAITVSAGADTRVHVRGTATVRLGFNVPANAPELAERIAASPPVSRTGDTIRLAPPATGIERNAVVLSYEVEVPGTARVKSTSNSGATAIRGVRGAVDVQTQSSAIALDDLGGRVTVETQSGSVRASGIASDMSVRTGSSAVSLSGLGGDLRVRTQSGAVEAAFTDRGDVDVQTGSSSIDLTNVDGALTVTTRSGRVRVSGKPTAAWQLTSGSSAIEIELERGSGGFSLDATSRSSHVRLEGLALNGTQSKGIARGTVGGGGPAVRISTRSGAVDVRAR